MSRAVVLQRVTELTEPPVVGRRYLVPTVRYPWHARVRAWPVFPPLHADGKFFNFDRPHYHVDPRFLDRRTMRFAAGWGYGAADFDLVERAAFAAVQRSPLSTRVDGRPDEDVPHPPIEWKAARCFRSAVGYQHSALPSVRALGAAYAGQVAPRNRAGWVCPHQRFPLGSVGPDADGVITCPLHGLRMRAADGVCLGADG